MGLFNRYSIQDQELPLIAPDCPEYRLLASRTLIYLQQAFSQVNTSLASPVRFACQWATSFRSTILCCSFVASPPKSTAISQNGSRATSRSWALRCGPWPSHGPGSGSSRAKRVEGRRFPARERRDRKILGFFHL
jgi:hypothetical protein